MPLIFFEKKQGIYPKLYKTVLPLKTSPCRNMVKLTLRNTAESIKSVEDYIAGNGSLKNEVFVDKNLVENAKLALQKMIDIVEAP